MYIPVAQILHGIINDSLSELRIGGIGSSGKCDIRDHLRGILLSSLFSCLQCLLCGNFRLFLFYCLRINKFFRDRHIFRRDIAFPAVGVLYLQPVSVILQNFYLFSIVNVTNSFCICGRILSHIQTVCGNHSISGHIIVYNLSCCISVNEKLCLDIALHITGYDPEPVLILSCHIQDLCHRSVIDFADYGTIGIRFRPDIHIICHIGDG